jgi:hypothetical protein
MRDVASVSLRILTKDDPEWHDLEGFDHTKLSAINMCPTWGITRYGMHRVMPGDRPEGVKPQSLAAGAAAHEAFASIRIAQLWQVYADHARHHACRIFGEDRASSLLSVISRSETEEARIRQVALEALYTSGFQDNPFDKRRTVSNLESSISAYAAGYDSARYPVWVASRHDPTGPVGIEIPFALLITFKLDRLREYRAKFTGRIDGIHWHWQEGGELLLQENKTGARLDDAWVKSFDVSHQITGYTLAGSLWTGVPIKRAIVRGVQLPLPRNITSGIQDIWTTREDYHKERWLAWLIHTCRLYERYRDDPINAPKYTHSCNRYFRSCPMIPFCYADQAEQEQILSEMMTDEWSPLDEAGDA